jgi:hypothetical protein
MRWSKRCAKASTFWRVRRFASSLMTWTCDRGKGVHLVGGVSSAGARAAPEEQARVEEFETSGIKRPLSFLLNNQPPKAQTIRVQVGGHEIGPRAGSIGGNAIQNRTVTARAENGINTVTVTWR